jgi:hypothetical protein
VCPSRKVLRLSRWHNTAIVPKAFVQPHWHNHAIQQRAGTTLTTVAMQGQDSNTLGDGTTFGWACNSATPLSHVLPLPFALRPVKHTTTPPLSLKVACLGLGHRQGTHLEHQTPNSNPCDHDVWSGNGIS